MVEKHFQKLNFWSKHLKIKTSKKLNLVFGAYRSLIVDFADLADDQLEVDLNWTVNCKTDETEKPQIKQIKLFLNFKNTRAFVWLNNVSTRKAANMKLGVALSCSNWLADLTNAIWPLKRYYKNKVYIYLENNVVDIF